MKTFSQWLHLGVFVLALTCRDASATKIVAQEATGGMHQELTVELVSPGAPIDVGAPVSKRYLASESTGMVIPDRVWNKASRARWVNLNVEELFDPLVESHERKATIRLEAFPGEAHWFSPRERRSRDGTTWIGDLVDGDNSGSLIISRSAKAVFGIAQVGHRRYIIESDRRRGSFVWEVNPLNEGACLTEGDVMSEKRGGPSMQLSPLGLLKPSISTSSNALPSASKYGGANDLDVLIYYNASVANDYWGDPSPYINALAASFNNVLYDGTITGTVNVVGYKEISTSNPVVEQDWRDKVSDMANGDSEWSGTPSLRADLAADVVVLLVKPNSPDVCGIANNILDEQLMTVYAENAPGIAFAVVSADCGGADLTVHHEVGHILGGQHEGASACGIGGSSCGFSDPNTSMRTIMADDANGAGACVVAGCPRVPRFSDYMEPIYLDSSYQYLGDSSDHDVAGTLGTTIGFTADYRDIVASAPGAASGMSALSCYSNHFLSWTSGSGAAGWQEVEVSSSSGFTFPLQILRAGVTEFNYESSSTFYARARSCNAAGCGAWSSTGPITANSCI